jgi:hypothetical protein
MKKPVAAATRRGSGRWLQGLVCGALVTLATPTALMAGVLLLPAIIVYLTDDGEGRATLRAVLLFGAAGSLRPLLALWTGGHSMGACMSLLSDMAVPALAWSAQGAGWLLAQMIPLLVRVTLEAQANVEIARIRAERTKLAQAWGLGNGEEDASV